MFKLNKKKNPYDYVFFLIKQQVVCIHPIKHWHIKAVFLKKKIVDTQHAQVTEFRLKISFDLKVTYSDNSIISYKVIKYINKELGMKIVPIFVFNIFTVLETFMSLFGLLRIFKLLCSFK